MKNKLTKPYRSLLEYITQSTTKNEDTAALLIRRRIRREIVSYGQLTTMLSKTEAFFRQEKISPGDKVLVWGMNCPEYAILLTGCFSFARVAVPIDYRTSQETVEKVIEKVKPKLAFVSRYLRTDFLKEKRIRRVFLEDFFKLLEVKGKPRPLSELVSVNSYYDPESVVEIVFTSGTTGAPKGVVMKQKNILANLTQIEPYLPELYRAQIVSVLPLSHMYEQMIGLLLPLGKAATIHYLPRINSYQLLKAFSEYKPTHQLFVPQLLKIIWDKIEERADEDGQLINLRFLLKISPMLPVFIRRMLFGKIHQLFGGNLKLIACGGAPLDPQIARNFLAIGIPVYEGYGATEVTAVATFSPIGAIRFGSCGKVVAGTRITLDESGQIYIAGDSVTDGYYLDDTRTKAAFSDNGFKTGDIGEMDEAGYLYIKGRDVFKIVLPSGDKVFVEDLEMKIKQDPKIEDICVVAKRLTDGDKIHAYFILKKRVTVTLPQLMKEINSQLEMKQQILSYEIWPNTDFPRTPTLKIDRRHMMEVANSAGKANKPRDTSGTNIVDMADIVAKVSGLPRQNISDRDLLSTDLKLDSLSRAELVSLTEEYLGIVIDESKITTQTTVGELKKLAATSEKLEEVILPTWQFSPIAEIVHRWLMKILIFPLHGYIIRISYPQGRLPQIQPGSILLFNHPGVGDVYCVLRTLARQRKFRVVVDATPSIWEKFYNKLRLLPLIHELTSGAVPLYDSGHRLLQVLRLNSDLIDRGYMLLFAPQGRQQRSATEDSFRPGTGYLVKELTRPVYIVKIKDYRDVWPAPATNVIDSKLRDLLPVRRGTVRVYVSDPIVRNWEEFTPIQITKFLEEKYRSIGRSN